MPCSPAPKHVFWDKSAKTLATRLAPFISIRAWMNANNRNLFEESSVYEYLRATCKGKGARAPSHQDAVMQALAFAEGVLTLPNI